MTQPTAPINPHQPGEQAMQNLGHPLTTPLNPAVDRTRAWVVLGAGAAAVVGSFLPWASVTAPFVGTISKAGTDGSDGWVTAATGALLLLWGFLALRGRPATAVSVLAVLGGVGAFGLALWTVRDLQMRAADLQAQMATGEDELGLASAMADAVQFRIGVGLWLVVAAGLVGAVAVGQTLLKRKH